METRVSLRMCCTLLANDLFFKCFKTVTVNVLIRKKYRYMYYNFKKKKKKKKKYFFKDTPLRASAITLHLCLLLQNILYMNGVLWPEADVGDWIFSSIGQEYPFLQVSQIFLSRPANSA